MRMAIIALVATAAAAASAVTATGAATETPSPLGASPAKGTGLPQGQCFRSRDIRNHTVLDRDTMLISTTDRKAVYRVTMAGGCLAGALSSDPIVTRNPPGSDIICKPIDMDIAIMQGGGGFKSQCIVESIVKLSPEQVAAIPRRSKP